MRSLYRRFASRTGPAVRVATGALLASSLAVPTGALALAQEEEEREPLSRREVSRALDIAEDLLDEAEEMERDGDPGANDKRGEAGGWFLRVLQDYPDRHDVRLELARVYFGFEEWENAADAYELAVAGLEDPDEVLEAWTNLTHAYSETRNDMKVIEAGRNVIDMNPDAGADTYIAVGAALARQGQFEEASELANQALAMAPDSAVAHATLGQAAAAGDDWEAAEASYARAVELDPNTDIAHAGLASIYFEREDYEAAIRSATAALELNDQLTAAFGIRGLANNALGNQSDAYGDLAMAITVNPDDPASNLAFAQVYEAQGNRSQAGVYFTKVADLANSPPSSKAMAHGALARFAVEDQRYEDAKSHLDAAESTGALSDDMMAEVAMAQHGLAKGLRQTGDVPGSLAAAGKAAAADPENPRYMLEHGIALFSNQSLPEAKEPLEMGIAGFPEDGDPNDLGLGHYALGQVLMGSNDFAGAEAQFVEAAARVDAWGEPFRWLAWAHTAQVAYGPCRLKDAAFGERLQAAQVGCPASEADHQRVAEAAAQYAKAVELGVEDAVLAERLAVLTEVRNQLVE